MSKGVSQFYCGHDVIITGSFASSNKFCVFLKIVFSRDIKRNVYNSTGSNGMMLQRLINVSYSRKIEKT